MGVYKMTIDTNTMISITEANQNFSSGHLQNDYFKQSAGAKTS